MKRPSNDRFVELASGCHWVDKPASFQRKIGMTGSRQYASKPLYIPGTIGEKGRAPRQGSACNHNPGMNEVNLKNIAGNEVSIFLFRFELRGRGIDFVLNEAIAADMYQEVDEELKPLVHACCETLLRYEHLSVSNTTPPQNCAKDVIEIGKIHSVRNPDQPDHHRADLAKHGS
jgi:hypothetical protein